MRYTSFGLGLIAWWGFVSHYAVASSAPTATAAESNKIVRSPSDTRCVVTDSATGVHRENVCASTVDQDGDACVWCPVGGLEGLCLTQDQIDFAEEAGVHCGRTEEYPIHCALAGYAAGDAGETVCKATHDDDTGRCAWCSSGGKGLCLTEEQSQFAQKVGLACDPVPRARVDLSCVLAGSASGLDAEHVCLSSVDQNGDTCIWCSVSGLCVTNDQVRIGHQAGAICFEDEVRAQDDPLDVTCAMATFHVAAADVKEVCKSSKDRDGVDCVWVDIFNKSVCLTVHGVRTIHSYLKGSPVDDSE